MKLNNSKVRKIHQNQISYLKYVTARQVPSTERFEAIPNSKPSELVKDNISSTKSQSPVIHTCFGAKKLEKSHTRTAQLLGQF